MEKPLEFSSQPSLGTTETFHSSKTQIFLALPSFSYISQNILVKVTLFIQNIVSSYQNMRLFYPNTSQQPVGIGAHSTPPPEGFTAPKTADAARNAELHGSQLLHQDSPPFLRELHAAIPYCATETGPSRQLLLETSHPPGGPHALVGR